MTRPRCRIFLIFASAATLFGALPGAKAGEHTPGRLKVNAISLGIVSQIHHREIEEHFRGFVRYVNRKLPSTSDNDGKIVFASTALQLAKFLKEKKVDFYMESPYLTFLVNTTGAAKLLLRRWKGGIAEYRSIVFTKRDGEIRRLDDLRGKIIAFEDPESTSGYFLPKVLLQRRGFELARMFAPDANISPLEATVPPTQVGYVFADSQEILLDLVVTKQVAAGAFGSHDHASLDAKNKANISILAETEALPRHLLSVRSDLALPLANRLKEILLSMHQDGEGRKLLHKADQTTKFDILPGGEAVMRRKLVDTFGSGVKR
jgi:phosphonate transport system substrate-binding protein